MPDPVAVNSMFGRIARRYDLANRILCAGIDTHWRKRLVESVRKYSPKQVLDLATGSGDVAFALAEAMGTDVEITAMDFCQPMLEQAEAKKKTGGARFGNIHFRAGDGLALPLPDQCCDAVTISFGLRNLANRELGLREMRRILRPGGRIHILEFSQPYRWLRPLYYFYLRWILPRVAGWITGDRAAYVYLNDTIAEFPDRAALSAEIARAGFSEVRAAALSCGIVALHQARR